MRSLTIVSVLAIVCCVLGAFGLGLWTVDSVHYGWHAPALVLASGISMLLINRKVKSSVSRR